MQKITFIRGNTGSTLVIAVVIAVMLLTLAMSLGQFISNGSGRQKRNIETIKAFWANEAAVNLGLRYVTRLDNIREVNEILTILDDDPVNGYAPEITITANLQQNIIKTVIAASVQLQQSDIWSISTVTASFITMQHWTCFEERTLADLPWVRGIVNGSYHTNGYIPVGYDITNETHVFGPTSASQRIYPSRTFDTDKFPKKYRYGIIRLDDNDHFYPGYADYDSTHRFSILRVFPDYTFIKRIDYQMITLNSGVFKDSAHYITYTSFGYSDLLIHLKDDVYDLERYYKDGSRWAVWGTDYPVATHPIIRTDKNLYVYGRLKGKMTVITTGDLYIAGNILYHDNDLTKVSNDNVLALISENDITIPRPGESRSAYYKFSDHSNTDVYASLFAVKGSWFVDDNTADNFNGRVNDFTIYGCVVVDHLGPTTVSGEGLRTIFKSDPRLMNNALAAPGMPQARGKDMEDTTSYINIIKQVLWDNKFETHN